MYLWLHGYLWSQGYLLSHSFCIAQDLLNAEMSFGLTEHSRTSGAGGVRSAQLELDLRSVAYHVRVLKKLGCIELVESLPRRGAVEHVYRAAEWVLKA